MLKKKMKGRKSCCFMVHLGTNTVVAYIAVASAPWSRPPTASASLPPTPYSHPPASTSPTHCLCPGQLRSCLCCHTRNCGHVAPILLGHPPICLLVPLSSPPHPHPPRPSSSLPAGPPVHSTLAVHTSFSSLSYCVRNEAPLI
jgi:hypothetical protein